MPSKILKTASVLAFERKLDPSDGLFSAGPWEDIEKSASWQGVFVREKSVRGTISNRLKPGAQDPAKLDASIQAPNLQTVDVATLPSDADTLRVQFTLRVLGGAGEPSACNNAEYREKLRQTMQIFKEQHGFNELSRRYAHNLANGRFLWRNRIGAESVRVNVHRIQNGEVNGGWEFDGLSFSLRNFETPEPYAQEIDELSNLIDSGLSGQSHVLLDVVAYVRMGHGQEVYPSQELILDRGDKKGQKSKTLYTINSIAGMHSQKIGNALRSIDTWYEGAQDIGPIAVEPYGSVTSEGRAYRQPKKKQDFYNLLDGWVLNGKTLDESQQQYVMATLIRGGVFGEKD